MYIVYNIQRLFPDEGMNTPTMEDLELQRKMLQAQLELAGVSDQLEVVDSVGDSGNDSQEEGFVPPMPPTPEQPPLPPGTPPVTPVMQRKAGSDARDSDTFKSPPPPGSNNTPSRMPLLRNSSTLTPQETSLQSMMKTPSTGGSMEMKYGTPIHLEKIPTPNKGLPELAKWSEGVSQHIPFENLPDATGNFAKMQKMLSIMKKRESL